MRVDKWLWAARFFKTRSLAARACELGRVEANGVLAKAAREVRQGDVIRVRNDGGEFTVVVVALSETRGPASVARLLYTETESSREARARAAEERRSLPGPGAWEDGRPSKKDRRALARWKGR